MLVYRRQSGDTLIEVVFALAILSAVLASAFGVANLTQRINQSAKEKTEAVNLVQEQAEALHSYRDKYLSASSVVTNSNNCPATTIATPGLLGLPLGAGSVTVHKFYMKQNGGEWQAFCTPNIRGLYTIWVAGSAAANESLFTIVVAWNSNVAGGTGANLVTTDVHLADIGGLKPIDCSDATTPRCSQ